MLWYMATTMCQGTWQSRDIRVIIIVPVWRYMIHGNNDVPRLQSRDIRVVIIVPVWRYMIHGNNDVPRLQSRDIRVVIIVPVWRYMIHGNNDVPRLQSRYPRDQYYRHNCNMVGRSRQCFQVQSTEWLLYQFYQGPGAVSLAITDYCSLCYSGLCGHIRINMLLAP